MSSCPCQRMPMYLPGLLGDVLADFCRELWVRKTQEEGCGGLRGENPGAFPKARPIFQQPFSLPENAQTLAGIAFCAAGKSANNFASKFARKLFQQRIADSHSLLEFSEWDIADLRDTCLEERVTLHRAPTLKTWELLF